MVSSLARRLGRLWPLIAIAAATLAAVAAVIVVVPRSIGGEAGPRAVIVDQLSLNAPDQAFVVDATAMLERAGYAVDYVPAKKVSVDFYRRLPTHHYEIILLRTHAGLRKAKDGTLAANLFTSEPYSKTRYADEQAAGRLKLAAGNREAFARGQIYFAISGSFVTDSMKGNFGGAAVVLMGCSAFRSQTLAQAFVQKGAGAVVGWDDLVSADHTDAATLDLLQHYLDVYMPLQDAAAAARTDVGPDPSSGAELLSYPSGN